MSYPDSDVERDPQDHKDPVRHGMSYPDSDGQFMTIWIAHSMTDRITRLYDPGQDRESG